MKDASCKGRARPWWLILVALVAGLSLAMLVAAKERPAGAKPSVALITSLPFLMGEEFSLNAEASAAPLARTLSDDMELVPIGVSEAAELEGQHSLLMLHPHAQTAQGLVDLDAWVRKGGRVLITADARLDYESSRPLGHRLRPPPSFADTGLLDHWGVRMFDGGDGIARFEAKGGSDCEVSNSGKRADCRVGKGRAIILGDSDPVMAQPGSDDARGLRSAIKQLLAD